MGKYICISSNGEMEEGALTLIGASSKRDNNNKIGYFGSGNKYAIASMIRNKVDFKIFSGKNELKVTTKDIKFRDSDYKQIFINDKETSLTTEMGGKFWDTPFPVIREIYSNAMDEGNSNLSIVSDILPEDNITKFYIKNDGYFDIIINNINEYFLNGIMPEYQSNIVNIYDKPMSTFNLYRKGIVATNFKDTKGIFRYSLMNIEVNESRLINNNWDAAREVAKGLLYCNNKYLITKLISAIHGSNAGLYEHTCFNRVYSGDFINEVWEEVLRDKKIVSVEYLMYTVEDRERFNGYIILQSDLVQALHNSFPNLYIEDFNEGNGAGFIASKSKEGLEDRILDTISKLMKTNYKDRIPMTYNLVYGVFKNDNTLAEIADDNVTIRLSNKLILQEDNQLAAILIEEFEHINTGFGDCTRNLQSHIFKLYAIELAKQIK